jgi:competence protein ComEA
VPAPLDEEPDGPLAVLTWSEPEPPAQPTPPARPEPPVLPGEPPAVGPSAALPVVGVVDRLRAARFDPGRRGAAGLALVGIVAALIASVVLLRGRPEQVAPPVLERAGVAVSGAPTGPGQAAPPQAAQLVVAVAGRVRRPGVVRLPAGSRVEDAVRAAGGVSPGASSGLLNLARPLVDGEQVLVGIEPTGAAAAQAAGGGGSGPVDLNAADAGALDALPGIGPVLAQRIVEWRTENGRFASVDQLREVPGIGEAKFGQLRSKVRV